MKHKKFREVIRLGVEPDTYADVYYESALDKFHL